MIFMTGTLQHSLYAGKNKFLRFILKMNICCFAFFLIPVAVFFLPMQATAEENQILKTASEKQIHAASIESSGKNTLLSIEEHDAMSIKAPGPMFYQALDLIKKDIGAADALFKNDGTPLSLCYCAWLRETKAVLPLDEEDSAMIFLERARAAIPEPEDGWQDSPEDWPDAGTPLMGMILSTMVHISSNSLDLYTFRLPTLE